MAKQGDEGSIETRMVNGVRQFKLKRSPVFYQAVISVGRALTGCYYDIYCEGSELIPKDGAVFIAAKHINIFDIIALNCCLERQLNVLHKVELSSNPVMDYLYRKMGGIKIDRENTLSQTTKEAIRYSKWLLGNGEIVALFPEMTRVEGFVGKLHPELITHYNKMVSQIPTYCVGVWYEDPVRWLKPKNRVELRIEEADMDGDSLEEIADSMGRQMARLSRVEYHPELSPKYKDKKGVMDSSG